MKKLLLTLVIGLFFGLYAEAQTHTYEIQYTYDASGNRIKRKLVTITLPELKTAMLEEDIIPVEETWKERQVSIYPNPTHGNLKVNITGGDPNLNYRYELYTTAGNKVREGRIIHAGETPVEMQHLSPGVYILILHANEEKLSYKIIKQ